MNFLAHQYLSFQCPPFMVGNFIADTLRGNSHSSLEKDIANGVRIHRAIDHFTDTHPTVSQTRYLLYPYFGKYASVVQDVYYDHFLAIHWESFSTIPLAQFVSDVYTTLDLYLPIFNERSQHTFYHMREHNWLGNYRHLEGINRSLKGLSRRAKFPSNMENGLGPLATHFSEMEKHFLFFFPLLEAHIAITFADEIEACRNTA